MVKLLFEKSQIDKLEVTAGLLTLQEEYSFEAVFEGAADITVTIKDVPGDKLSVKLANGKAEFTFDFTRRNHFFRLLGLLLEQLTYDKTAFEIEETGFFKRNSHPSSVFPTTDKSPNSTAQSTILSII